MVFVHDICDAISDYGGMRLTCLFEEGYVADTATVSDAIDDIFRKLRFKNIVAADSRLLVEQGRWVDNIW